MPRIPAQRNARSFGMLEIPMAALAAPVHKSGFLQVGNQLSHLARHISINLVSQLFSAVNRLKNDSVGAGEIFHRAVSRFHFQSLAGRCFSLAVIEAKKYF